MRPGSAGHKDRGGQGTWMGREREEDESERGQKTQVRRSEDKKEQNENGKRNQQQGEGHAPSGGGSTIAGAFRRRTDSRRGNFATRVETLGAQE